MTENREFENRPEDAGEQPAPDGAAVKEPKHSAVSRLLNRFFHHIDRGGTLRGEVAAGLTMFALAFCSVFLTMQVLANAQGAYALESGEGADFYTSVYLAAMGVSFIGTLVIGLVARLPFVQMSGLSLTTMMIALLGADNGLTYYNLIFISFLCSVLYAVVVSVPFVKEQVFAALPRPIRKVLPAATGLVLAFIALQTSGLISFTDVTVYHTDEALSSGWSGVLSIPQIGAFSEMSEVLNAAMWLSFLSTIIAVVLYFVFKAMKLRHPAGVSFLLGTVLFFGLAFLIYPSAVTGWGRLWLVGADDAVQAHIGGGFETLFSNFGKAFSSETGGGLDFTAYEGSVPALIIGGLISFLMLSMYDAEATFVAADEHLNLGADEQKNVMLAQICNAGMGVVSALAGVTPVQVGKESVAATGDGAKSGIASVVASLGFLLSMFLWVFVFFFATYTNPDVAFANGEYGHYGQGAYQLIIICTFGIADAVMIGVSLSMMKCLKNINWHEAAEWLPAVVTALASLAFCNLAYGVGVGVIVYCIVYLLSFRSSPDEQFLPAAKANFLTRLKGIGIPTGCLAVLSILMFFML